MRRTHAPTHAPRTGLRATCVCVSVHSDCVHACACAVFLCVRAFLRLCTVSACMRARVLCFIACVRLCMCLRARVRVCSRFLFFSYSLILNLLIFYSFDLGGGTNNVVHNGPVGSQSILPCTRVRARVRVLLRACACARVCVQRAYVCLCTLTACTRVRVLCSSACVRLCPCAP